MNMADLTRTTIEHNPTVDPHTVQLKTLQAYRQAGKQVNTRVMLVTEPLFWAGAVAVPVYGFAGPMAVGGIAAMLGTDLIQRGTRRMLDRDAKKQIPEHHHHFAPDAPPSRLAARTERILHRDFGLQ